MSALLEYQILRTRRANATAMWPARRVNARSQHGRQAHVHRHYNAVSSPSHIHPRIDMERSRPNEATLLSDTNNGEKRFLLAVNTRCDIVEL